MKRILNYIIALVWLVNGLFCKLLDLVPRHREIVGSVLRTEHALLFTKLIGIAEIIMAIWIVSRIQTKLNALTQIIVIATMNTIEFLLVPDLLLWGIWNVVFAFAFILVIYYNEFFWNKIVKQQH